MTTISSHGTLVAVDAQNLYYSARRAGGKVDYQRLWLRIQNSGEESLVIVYLVRGEFDSSSFESLLRGIGFRISYRTAEHVPLVDRTRVKYDSHDIRIALDAAIRYSKDYERFVLVSGDRDFSDLFKELLKQGKETEFWSFDRSLCPEMLNTVDKVEFLGSDIFQDLA